MASGLVRVPIDPSAPQRDIEAQFEHAGAKAILVESGLAARVSEFDIMRFDLGSEELENTSRQQMHAVPFPKSTPISSPH